MPSGSIVISLSGLDGAGKSTQISMIEEYCQSRGLQTKILVMYDDVSLSNRLQRLLQPWKPRIRPARKKMNRARPSVDSRGLRVDKNFFSWPTFVVKPFAYVADVLLLRIQLAKLSRQCDVVTCDRFIYDTLVNLIALRDNSFVRAFIRMALTLAPRPDIAVLLDVPAEVAFARKPEYPVEYGTKRLKGYGYVFSTLSAGRKVYASGARESMFEAIREALDELTA